MIGVNDWLARATNLLLALRDAGLQSAIGEQLKILRLLQLLEERGAAPQTPEELTRWVAPVLCTRSDQVPRLLTVLKQQFAPGSVPQSRTSTSVVTPGPRSSLAWVWFLASLLVLAASLAGIFWLTPALLVQVVPAAREFLKLSASSHGFSQRENIIFVIVLVVGSGTIGWLIYRRIRLALTTQSCGALHAF
jgi:hypothetical protein